MTTLIWITIILKLSLWVYMGGHCNIVPFENFHFQYNTLESGLFVTQGGQKKVTDMPDDK